jgi:putative phosphoesterase
MRILVVSDTHGNYAALRRLPEVGVDRVICLGDLVDYGPEPRECIAWLRRREAIAVRGNHDEAAANGVDCRCSPAFRRLSRATRELTRRLLDAEDLELLRSLPLERDIELDGRRIHLVHATPSDPLFAYLGPDDVDRWAAEVEDLPADLILVGHTHLPMILRVGGKTIVNPGSLGQPKDGDPRAAFAVIEDGEPRLVRVRYDVEATVASLGRSGLADDVVASLATVLRTGGREGADRAAPVPRSG